MTYHAHIPSPPAARAGVSVRALIARVDYVCGVVGITPARFSRQMGDPRLIGDVRSRRRNPRWRTRERILNHAERVMQEARERAFTTLIDHFERDDVEAAVDGLIAMLDDRDGDPDVETIGNEEDFVRHEGSGPGCPISDPDMAAEDPAAPDAGDRSYAEWHTLPGNPRRHGAIDGKPSEGWSASLDEDAEDDDRDAEQDDREPEHEGDPLDAGEHDEVEGCYAAPFYGADQTGRTYRSSGEAGETLAFGRVVSRVV